MIAIQSLSSRQGVFCRALYGGQHRHNISRDGDSLLSCKDNLWSYVDNGSWWLWVSSFICAKLAQSYNFFCRYAIFFAYL